MSSSSYKSADELFAAAIALAPDQRTRFLDQVCNTDTLLRSELEVLIHSHDQAGDFLESPPVSLSDSSPLLSPLEEAPIPDRIAHFRVTGLLGAGGMGRVYLAESEHPRRLVALKVIKPGMASRAMLRRFEQEAQVVARLQHPGIAQIYEAGMAETAAGNQPYFAMEYVKGKTITEYIRSGKLGSRERLELFCKVCDAVAHAHSKGVIHRDLKPANILVDASDDGAGQPKILDFGVARLSDPDTATTTLHTHAGQLIGTLAYMSPEQVMGEPGTVDARSDVYTLGVILYEILTGKMPHDVSQRSIPEAIRIIREDTPSALSTIDRSYRGDVETIVSKALEKEKERRYQSAGDFAEDVRRSLRDEPIEARPPSTWYQLAKFAKRNKAVVGGTIAAFVALTLGLVAAVTQAQVAEAAKEDAIQQADAADIARAEAEAAKKDAIKQADDANTARAQAEAAKKDAIKQAEDAETARAQAESNLDVSNGINRFLKQLLSSPNPDQRLGRDVTVLQALERSETYLDETMPRQPHIRAAIHRTIGETYRSLTEYSKAEPHLRQACKLHEEAYGPEHPETLLSVSSLCMLLLEAGKIPEALERTEQAWETAQKALPESDPTRLSLGSTLAEVYNERGDVEGAIALRKFILAEREKTLAEDDPVLLNARHLLSRLLSASGKYAESIPMGHSIVEAHRKSGRPVTGTVIMWYVGLGIDLVETRHLDEAGTLIDEMIPMAESIYAPDHPGLLTVINLKGNYLMDRNDLEGAEAIFRSVIASYRKSELPAKVGLARVLTNLGTVLQSRKKLTDAESAFREAVELTTEPGKKPDRVGLAALTGLATVVRLQKRFDEALVLYQRIVETAEQVLKPDDWHLAVHKYGYAIVLMSQNQLPQAEKQLLGANDIAAKTFQADDERLVTVRRSLVDLYDHWEKPEEAKRWREQLPAKYR